MNADGFSFSVMVGIAETYLPAFVLARGLGDLNAALIATLPVLLGSIVQLFAPFALKRLGSYRRFVVTTASIQACSMLMLMSMAFVQDLPAWAVFVPATLYWAAGLATGPAWNTWAEQLVPQRIRSGFFARRSRLCHVGVLAGLISGGLLLRWSVSRDLTVAVFSILFGVGAIGRFVSACMLARQTEIRVASMPRGTGAEELGVDRIAPRERLAAVLQTIRHPGAAGRLVLYLMAVQTAVHISGPYFNPFMLKILKLTWVEYMGLLSMAFIGKMLSLPWAGRFANRFGADRLLWVGSVGIMPISALWYVSTNCWFLACVQLLSGLVWGCYELAMLLQFFRQIPGEKRVAVLTVYNLGNSLAMVLGTLIGAWIVNSLGRNYEAYMMVFVGSAGCRLVSLIGLPGRRHAVRTTRSTVKGWIASAAPKRKAVNAIPDANSGFVLEGEAEPQPMMALSDTLIFDMPPDAVRIDQAHATPASDASVVFVSSVTGDSSVCRSGESGSSVSRRREIPGANRINNRPVIARTEPAAGDP
ncbi:MAG: MFS transporter [Planctomycetota bacterium]